MDEPYLEMFKAAAAEHELDWRLLLEQAWRESRWNPKAVGGAGEYGLMQVLPSTWDQWAKKLGMTDKDPFDPESNIRLAAAYHVWLREQLQKAGHTEDYWVVTAYNWGINNLLRLLNGGGGWGEIPERVRAYTCDIILAREVRAAKESSA